MGVHQGTGLAQIERDDVDFALRSGDGGPSFGLESPDGEWFQALPGESLEDHAFREGALRRDRRGLRRGWNALDEGQWEETPG